jgi:plant 4alpha-monomethylsterol monooxygenase
VILLVCSLQEGPAYHDYHHAKFTGNYAAIFPIWDRLCGTLSDGYPAYLEARAGANGNSPKPRQHLEAEGGRSKGS